jgi:hypothetical protein
LKLNQKVPDSAYQATQHCAKIPDIKVGADMALLKEGFASPKIIAKRIVKPKQRENQTIIQKEKPAYE